MFGSRFFWVIVGRLVVAMVVVVVDEGIIPHLSYLLVFHGLLAVV